MKVSALNRISKLEIKNAGSIHSMTEEARQKWREANRERLRWEMFLRVRGPDSDWDTIPGKKPDLTDPEEIARKAFRDAFRKALPHYSGDMEIEDIDFSGMNEAEKAFVICLDCYFNETDDFDLLSWDFENGEEKLGLGDNVLPTFDELIEAIDKFYGNPNWKEIYGTQETQNDAMERLRNRYESRRERRLRYLAEHPEELA